MPYPYAGKYLRINLKSGEVEDVILEPEIVKQFLLGSGFAAFLFKQELDKGCVPEDPLDPANTLYAFNGLLTGTFAPTGCRSSWCARSPLTGIWGESNVGGHWGAELRFAGYDGLVIDEGSDEPVYLWIDGRSGTVEIRDAQHLWGLDQYDTHEKVRAETDGRAQIASIGPAGENLVRFASIMQGGANHSRAAGRTGMGAVMGVKNLKAIAVRGKVKPQYPDLSAFRDHVKQMNTVIREKSAGATMYGTAGGIPGAEVVGDLPLKNWQEGSWADGAHAISGQQIHETIWVKHMYCFACPIGCGKQVEITKGPYAGLKGESPEYETIGGFGSNLLIDDLDAVVKMNDMCNRLGLDTITASGVIAFAIEAFNRGLLTTKDTGGLYLDWGKPEPVLVLIQQIVAREGLGEKLSLGSRAVAGELGPEAEEFVLHVKGMEPPYHDPRAFVDMALSYATANRGACHLESGTYYLGYGYRWPDWHDEERDRFEGGEVSARLVMDFQDYLSTYNPLGLCKFIIKSEIGPAQIAELVNKATGWDWTEDNVMTVGRRIFNLKRSINVALGITRADDTLPKRFLTLARPSGSAEGVLPDLEPMLQAYYELRGWDDEGRPQN
jgi:aldehyde:ferredoxin oxidoreductase